LIWPQKGAKNTKIKFNLIANDSMGIKTG